MKKLRRSILYWLLLSPLVAVTLFPFMVMFVTAIKPQTEVHDPELVAKRAGLGKLCRNVASYRIWKSAAQFALRIVSRHSRGNRRFDSGCLCA